MAYHYHIGIQRNKINLINYGMTSIDILMKTIQKYFADFSEF